ncbi:MAG: 4-hydroxy-tetrahydrodipicolinate synthase [Tissierellia bacterium]|nr:4-hydroxy-tetrahydrodipicolinate synthase [Tissierellia bacterium]
MLFKGSGVAIVTPFNGDGSVDYEGLVDLLEFQIENGTDAIIIIGTTGEASTMTEEEKISVIKKTIKVVDNRVPVIAGTGSNDTAAAAAFSKKVADLGVDGLLVVTPYYNKTSKRGLLEHFKKIANAVAPVPIILYTVPGRTGVHIPIETVSELSKIENIVGIKDATGDITYSMDISINTADDFAIYSGNDDMILPILSVGGSGVISVVANCLPRETHDIVESYLNGDSKKSMEIQLRLKPFIDSLFMETNPIPVKAALNLMGLPSGELRLPLYKAEDNTVETLKENLKNLGIIGD